jgi:hypothetical protein
MQMPYDRDEVHDRGPHEQVQIRKSAKELSRESEWARSGRTVLRINSIWAGELLLNCRWQRDSAVTMDLDPS